MDTNSNQYAKVETEHLYIYSSPQSHSLLNTILIYIITYSSLSISLFLYSCLGKWMLIQTLYRMILHFKLDFLQSFSTLILELLLLAKSLISLSHIEGQKLRFKTYRNFRFFAIKPIHFEETWHHSISSLLKLGSFVATKDNDPSVKFSQ